MIEPTTFDALVDLALGAVFAAAWFGIGWYARRAYVRRLGHRWVENFIKELREDRAVQEAETLLALRRVREGRRLM